MTRPPLKLALLLAVALAGCATPRPVLYPNDYLTSVGKAKSEQDIAACEAAAQAGGATPAQSTGSQTATRTATGAAVGAGSGAVAGAITGNVGSGLGIGAATGAAAGLLSSAFTKPQPSEAYKGFVDTCLTEKGYQPVGWQ